MPGRAQRAHFNQQLQRRTFNRFCVRDTAPGGAGPPLRRALWWCSFCSSSLVLPIPHHLFSHFSPLHTHAPTHKHARAHTRTHAHPHTPHAPGGARSPHSHIRGGQEPSSLWLIQFDATNLVRSLRRCKRNWRRRTTNNATSRDAPAPGLPGSTWSGDPASSCPPSPAECWRWTPAVRQDGM